jgi:Immunity protein Imm1
VQVQVLDFEGTKQIDDEADLVSLLRSVRRGEYGAFTLSRDAEKESLWVLINGGVAYLHYFPDLEGRHPGYQPTGMEPKGTERSVWFEQQTVGGGFEMPAETLVPADVAYQAARDFYRTAGLPRSVSWFEL